MGLVRNGQFLAPFGTACGEHFAAVGGSHSFTEAVLVDSLLLRGLESPFRRFIFLDIYLFGLPRCRPRPLRNPLLPERCADITGARSAKVKQF